MKKSHPLISVTITTFNRVSLLQRCVDSVLSQDYPNLEIVIVDDHSFDETLFFLDTLVRNHKHIRYIQHDRNSGLAVARNTAWRATKGKYVAFLDDDDYWTDAGKLSLQIKALEQTDSNIGICCTQVTSKNNDVLVTTPTQFPPHIKSHILKRNGVIHTSTAVVPKHILEEVGGFDERMPRGIDSEIYRNIITRYNYDVLFLPKATTYYETAGNDRITTRSGLVEAKRFAFAHAYLLWKYRWQYLRNPKAMFSRIRNLIKTTYCSMLNKS